MLWTTALQLRSKRWETRLVAAKALAEYRSPRAITALAAALHDENGHVAEAAALSLGRIGGARVVPHLIAMLIDPRLWMRETAVRTLEQADPNWEASKAATKAVPDLLMALKSEEQDIREAAEEALGDIGDRRAVEPMVASLKNRGKMTVVEALGKIRDRRAIEPLVARLTDPRPWMRQAVEAALNRIDRNWNMDAAAIHAVPGLIALLRDRSSDTNMLVRTAAALALGKMADRRAIEPLMEALQEGGFVGHAAEESLNRLEPNWQKHEAARRQIPVFVSLLKDEELEVRLAAIRELGRSGDASVVAPLSEALVDAHPAVRRGAAEALAKIDPHWNRAEALATAVPRFLEALNSDNDEVRSSAAMVLANVRRPAVEKALISAFNRRRLPAIADALAGCGGSAATTPLIAALGDASFYVRLAAERALNKIRPDWAVSREAMEAIPAFGRDLHRHADADARKASADALGKVGDERAIDLLLKGLKDDNELVRKAAGEALKKVRTRCGKPPR